MPQAVIAWLAEVFVSWGATAAVATAVATIVVDGAIIAGSVAYSSSQQRKLQRAIGASQATSAIDQGRNIMVRDPVAARRLIYGEILTSGTIVYMVTSGTTNEYLTIVVVLAGHECDALGTIYFDDTVIPLDGSGNATGTYAGYATVKKFLGIAAGERDTDLETASAGAWTSNHVGKNIARLHVTLKTNPDLFINGIPVIRCLVKGKKVYDFRSSTTAWSANTALCTADFLMDAKFGKGIALARINSAEVIAAANICDEAVVLLDTSTEARYTCNGTYYCDADPDGALLDIVAAMAGHVCDAGGSWIIRAGAWRSPDLSLTDDDLCGAFSVVPRQSRQDTYNGVKGTYIAAINNWAPADFPAVINAVAAGSFVVGKRYSILSVGSTSFTSIGASANTVGVSFVATGAGSGSGTADPYMANDGNRRLWKDVIYNYTVSPATAQRLGKIDLESGRRQITVTGEYMLKVMQCQPGDIIDVTRASLGWAAKYFEVSGWSFKFNQGSGGPTLSILLNLREMDSAVFNWSNGQETAAPVAVVPVVADPRVVPTPGTPTLSAANFVQADGSILPRLQVAWTVAADTLVTNGGYTDIEYKKSADSDWIIWSSPRGDLTADYITDVQVGISYDVRIRFENHFGVRSAYSSTVSMILTTSAVALPSLSPNGGLFTTSVTIVASCATSGATIRYTVDGTPVNSSSTAFPGGGLTITTSTTLRVRAFNGGDMSNEVSQAYTLNSTTPQVATPSISFSPASYSSSSTVTGCVITCGTSGASIFYRINGGSWTAYSSFAETSGNLVEAYATHSGMTDSNVASATYIHA